MLSAIRTHICNRVVTGVFVVQELRCREEELTKAALQHKIQEELLKKREEELASREIDLLERELNILILQQVMHKPTPEKRRKSKIRLKHMKTGGRAISEPSGKTFQLSLLWSVYIGWSFFIWHLMFLHVVLQWLQALCLCRIDIGRYCSMPWDTTSWVDVVQGFKMDRGRQTPF